MKTEFILSLAANYVSHWTIVDATREIFQNALDQWTTNKQKKMTWKWVEDKSTRLWTLKIISRNTKLSRRSLLLGHTSKTDNPDTIGQFGEGYKIALLVATRLDKPIVIENQKAGEIWSSSLEYNPDFDAKALKVEILPGDTGSSLVFNINNLTDEDRCNIINSNLYLQDPNSLMKYETPHGSVITSRAHRRKVFVNGLYVTTLSSSKFMYGYNFRSKDLTLDRDRRMASSFEVSWSTSRIWNRLTKTHLDQVTKMLSQGASDVEYLSNFSKKDTSDLIYKSSKLPLGTLVVSNQTEINELKSQYGDHVKFSVVPSSMKSEIVKSESYTKSIEPVTSSIRRKSPSDHLCDLVKLWKIYYNTSLDSDLEKFSLKLDNINSMSRNWRSL